MRRGGGERRSGGCGGSESVEVDEGGGVLGLVTEIGGGVEGVDDDGFAALDLAATEGAGVLAVALLPLTETGRAEEMTAGLEFDVLVVLGADLAELEGRAHLAVDLVLLW